MIFEFSIQEGALYLIELRQLRYLVAASEAGSFNRAARKLGIKQATLSRHILQVEQRLGMIIFDRTTRGAIPTPDGASYLLGARRLVGEFDQLNHWVRQKKDGIIGQIAVGFHTSISAGNLRGTLAAFRAAYPDIHIDYVERDRTHLLRDVECGMLDIAILIGEVPEPDLKHQTLWSDRIIVVLPDGHVLAEKEQIVFSDLLRETILLSASDPGPQIQKLLMARIGTPFLQPHIEVRDVSRETLLCIVAIGGGITLTSEAVLGLGIEGLHYRDLIESTGQFRAGYSGYWREDNRNPVLMRFLKFVRERYSLPPLRI